MAKTTTDTEVTIEALLEQRSQYEEWILRLDTTGDKASPAVRQRVRGDYEARLESVMEQLRGRERGHRRGAGAAARLPGRARSRTALRGRGAGRGRGAALRWRVQRGGVAAA